nr:hypothetical protein [Phycicoccus elongatus]
MSVERRDALQLGSVRPVDERPGRLDRGTGTRIIGHGLLEHIEHVLGMHHHVTHDGAELAYRQIEVSRYGAAVLCHVHQ